MIKNGVAGGAGQLGHHVLRFGRCLLFIALFVMVRCPCFISNSVATLRVLTVVVKGGCLIRGFRLLPLLFHCY